MPWSVRIAYKVVLNNQTKYESTEIKFKIIRYYSYITNRAYVNILKYVN